MKSRITRNRLKRGCAAMVIVALQWQMLATAQAAVSQLPALYTSPPDSNVMFTLDDSGSMNSDVIPDFNTNDPNLPTDANSGFPGFGSQFPFMWTSNSSYLSATYYDIDNAAARYIRSSAGNPLYYDRRVTYTPWPKADNDKTFHPNATKSAVNIDADDPFNTARTVDLTRRAGSSGARYYPATYFVYKKDPPFNLSLSDLPTSSKALPSRIISSQNAANNFEKIEIRSDVLTYYRADTRTDCTGSFGAGGCTYDQELQNFANWLQYYRSRALMAKGGVATAFSKQGTNLRVGLASLNATNTIRRGVRAFSGTNRQNFYTELYGISVGGGTPLRRAMDIVGEYFQQTGAGNPWAEDPAASGVGTEFSCRRSFHIMSTDGFWNGASATDDPVNNNDNYSGDTPKKPDGTFYTYSNTATSATDPLVARFSSNPFSDTRSDTLADVAAYYWKTDLRPTLANNVAPSERDPAFWQHLTTFTVGLGINGTGGVKKADGTAADLTTQNARDLLVVNRTGLTWTAPVADAETTGDDLIHASMNGRGRYFSATNPTALANGLASALAEAADIPLDLAAVAADSPQVAANGVIYQGTFSPQGWYGRLYAFPQNAVTGTVNTNPGAANWEASNKMPEPSARNIYTIDTSTLSAPVGKPFTWTGLNATQRTNLDNSEDLLNYLRGSNAKELANNGTFRDRVRYTVNGVKGGVLGDIVNGAPIKGPDAGGSYDRLSSSTESTAYTTFRSGTTLDAMRDTIFAGANDGMLHAFNTNDGVERFAYVPNAVFSVPVTSGTEQRLKMLSEVAYPHRFLVDGPPNISDAYLNSQWKTLLVGSTGAGAKALFAMDVTNPVVATDGFGTGKILWEFSQQNSTDMGHVLGYAHVGKMRNGSWAAFFGNGYDSQTGQAKLFILNAGTGTIIREFAVDTAGSNGLSMPNFVLNANREVETIYAGDLKGQLWKFDVSSTNASDWKVAFSSKPLFTTKGGVNQPITVMPEITYNDVEKGGAIVTFGTGKMFEASDTAASGNVNLNLQAIYGIWDKEGETSGVGTGYTPLQKRVAPSTPTAPTTVPTTGEFQAMSLTDNDNDDAMDWKTKRGWYIELSAKGERVNVNPQQFKKSVFVIANTPDTADPCALGGLARIFAINPLTGLPPALPVFDVNGDGTFTAADIGNILVNRKGVLTQPIFQLPALAGLTVLPTVSVSPFVLFDRGQASGGRSGGVELSKSSGGSLSGNVPCGAVMSSGRSDTSVLTVSVSCADDDKKTTGKKRISWKQLL